MWQVGLTNLILGKNVQDPFKNCQLKGCKHQLQAFIVCLSSSYTLEQALDLGMYTFMYSIFITHLKTIKVL